MKNLKRVNKTIIKSIIKKQGACTVNMLPCKVRLENMWMSPYEIKLTSLEELEKTINQYAYYNCNNELGYYPAYYINA